MSTLWTQAAPWVDPSLIASPFVIAGYLYGRRKNPRAWACMAISNVLLASIGARSIFAVPHHVGLLVSAGLAVVAVWNYLTWKRGPAIGRRESVEPEWLNAGEWAA
jgi:hypothetical protein